MSNHLSSAFRVRVRATCLSAEAGIAIFSILSTIRDSLLLMCLVNLESSFLFVVR